MVKLHGWLRRLTFRQEPSLRVAVVRFKGDFITHYCILPCMCSCRDVRYYHYIEMNKLWLVLQHHGSITKEDEEPSQAKHDVFNMWSHVGMGLSVVDHAFVLKGDIAGATIVLGFLFSQTYSALMISIMPSPGLLSMCVYNNSFTVSGGCLCQQNPSKNVHLHRSSSNQPHKSVPLLHSHSLTQPLTAMITLSCGYYSGCSVTTATRDFPLWK